MSLEIFHVYNDVGALIHWAYKELTVLIGIPKEIYKDESRVAATPITVKKLVELGYSVSVERGAGDKSSCPDSAYVEVGAEIVKDTASLWSNADLILKVRPPQENADLNKHETLFRKKAQV